VQTPRIQRLRFLAGQAVNLSLNNGLATDYFIASCPCDDRNLLFHIPYDADNPFTQALVNETKKGDPVTVIGPHGHFLFNEESERPQLYLAYGAGFAPIKSLIEHAMALEIPANMDLFWSVDKEEDLYIHNQCRAWDDALEDFNYHPVINDDAVEQLLAQQHKLNAVDVYLCGPESRVMQASEKLLANGLPHEQLIVSTID
jgi:CDP-4-dehydro-6-deoxyglucose reductase